MANNVRNGVVFAPNNIIQGLAVTRSASPRAVASPVVSPDLARQSAMPGGSGSLARQASPLPMTPNNHFNVDNAKMAQPPSAVSPGNGMVPVDLRVGMPSTGMAVLDNACGMARKS